MKRLYVIALVALATGVGAGGAEGATYTHAKLALHLTHPPSKNTTAIVCGTESPVGLNIPCSAYVVDGTTGAKRWVLNPADEILIGKRDEEGARPGAIGVEGLPRSALVAR